MRAIIALMLSSVGCAAAQAIVVAWNANTETNVAGYRIYHGPSSRNYTSVIDVKAPATTATLTNLARGENFIAATAYDTSGLESDYSAEVFYVLPTPPKPPTEIKLTYRIVSARSMLGPWTNIASTEVTIPLRPDARFFRGTIDAVPQGP